ncbi:MAG: hypothetical protein N3G79_02195 [Sulfolobales archaeon]|nr:hypothetical protein [Sulfolobales archaeon]
MLYAYFLAFVILALIVALVKVFMRLPARKEATPPPMPAEVLTPRPEVREAPRPAVAESNLVAAAVAAVAAHLSLHRVGPPTTTVQASAPTHTWTHMWRVQVSKSLNELCLMKYVQRRTRTI